MKGDDEIMDDGKFRKMRGFTTVQNSAIRDCRLSMRARGLYTIMSSFLTMEDKEWKKSEFIHMVERTDGRKTFEKTWIELKEAGYLKAHVYLNGRNQCRTIYELLEEPVEGPHTFYYNGKGELSTDNVRLAEKRKDAHP